MTDEELVAAACPKIGAMGGAFYFAPGTLAHGKELGLDGFRFYIAGRGGVLGDADAAPVASGLGYFEPELVARMWDSAREIVSPRTAAAAYLECSAAFGRDRFAAVADLDRFCAAAGAVNDAAEPAGLSLYSGVATLPLASDLPGRAMQLVTVLREFRGSAHLVAIIASGLTARRAHALRRPNDVKMFGWDEEVPEPTDDERSRLQAADALTDRLVQPAFGVLDDAGRQHLLDGLDAMAKALSSEATTRGGAK